MPGYLSVRVSIPLSWMAASSVDGARSSAVLKTAAIFNHNRVHLSTLLPFLAPFSVPVSLFQPSLFVVEVGGGGYFPSNIKPAYRGALGPPSRGAARTRCIGCCPFPSRSQTDHIYFSRNDKDFLKKQPPPPKKKKLTQTNQPSFPAFDFTKPGLKAPELSQHN